MPTGAPSAQKIIDAWSSVTDEWFARLNKMHDDGRLWEVVHAWHARENGCKLIADDTMKVVERFAGPHEAHAKAHDLEQLARASAVQAMFVEWNK
jgi:hypothetical protein